MIPLLLISHCPTYEVPKNHNESSSSFFLGCNYLRTAVLGQCINSIFLIQKKIISDFLFFRYRKHYNLHGLQSKMLEGIFLIFCAKKLHFSPVRLWIKTRFFPGHSMSTFCGFFSVPWRQRHSTAIPRTNTEFNNSQKKIYKSFYT